MIEDEQPARATVLYAGTRPVPRPRERMVGSGRALMITVLSLLAALIVSGVVLAVILGVYGYRTYRDKQRQEPVITRIDGFPPASDDAPLPRPQKGVMPATPIGNQGDWFPPEAYPAEARRRGEQGRVAVKLSIDIAGRVAGCTVTASSGSATLDRETCNLARRNARFTPASRNGVAVPSTFQMRSVRWQLDGGSEHEKASMQVGSSPQPLMDSSVEVAVTSDGRVSGCKVIRHQAGGDPCASVPIGRPMFPPLVRDGRPTAARARITNSLVLLPPE